MSRLLNSQRSSRRNPRRARLIGNLKLAALCGGMVWLGSVIRSPYLYAERMSRENDRLERKQMAGKVVLQNLEKSVAASRTPQGMEKEARRLGFVRPGEVPLVITEM